MLRVNNHPIGEKSPNLVTLIQIYTITTLIKLPTKKIIAMMYEVLKTLKPARFEPTIFFSTTLKRRV
jgi:hypothetical protein